ncbi:MAG: hypothetical protein ACI9TO_000763 [Rickettsiales bacterium]
MFSKFKNLVLLLSLLLLSSCNNSESYLFTYQSKLRIIERADHQKCISKGLDYGQWDEITTEMYWRCRYGLIMDRKIHLAITPSAIKNNGIVKKASEEILRNLSKAKYSALAKLDEDIDLSDHKKCLSGVFNLGINDNNDAYYLCRERLVLARIPPAPKVTHSYETAILPPKRAREYLQIAQESRGKSKMSNKFAEIMQKYPHCIGLNTNSEDFKKCTNAADRAKICINGIRSLKIKKSLQDKIYCQKQAFVQFPDNYALAKNKSSTEIDRLKTKLKKQKNKEMAESNNATLLYLEGEREMKKNIGKKVDYGDKNEDKSEVQLYNKIELLKLRENFVYQCNKKMDDKLPDFAQDLFEDCNDIAKDWDK